MPRPGIKQIDAIQIRTIRNVHHRWWSTLKPDLVSRLGTNGLVNQNNFSKITTHRQLSV